MVCSTTTGITCLGEACCKMEMVSGTKVSSATSLVMNMELKKHSATSTPDTIRTPEAFWVISRDILRNRPS